LKCGEKGYLRRRIDLGKRIADGSAERSRKGRISLDGKHYQKVDGIERCENAGKMGEELESRIAQEIVRVAEKGNTVREDRAEERGFLEGAQLEEEVGREGATKGA
jgi:hypothetical protein